MRIILTHVCNACVCVCLNVHVVREVGYCSVLAFSSSLCLCERDQEREL